MDNQESEKMLHWKKHYVVGTGFYGSSVYFASPMGDPSYFCSPPFAAVKSSEFQYSSPLRKEGKILQELRGCPYILHCFGEDESLENGKRTYNLLLEFAQGGTLRDLLNSKVGKKISEEEAAYYTYQILMAILHIHSKGYIHCDINPQNILVFPNAVIHANGVNNRLKLADFGSALRKGEKTCLKSSEAKGKEDGLELHIVCKHPKIPNDVSAIAMDFIKKCLERKHERRCTAEDLIKHPFVQNFLDASTDWISKRDMFNAHSRDTLGSHFIPFKLFP
ncbi:mitogen-activated protein kinase kinase kinase 20-like [Nicotiana tomentosiformis]|uniref:mitogen-activated protein kinase kinase kinase 20-like n=1 Tax=Nicotiana tomentosiformis TaxID=4098 RepID=UPI00388C3910